MTYDAANRPTARSGGILEASAMSDDDLDAALIGALVDALVGLVGA